MIEIVEKQDGAWMHFVAPNGMDALVSLSSGPITRRAIVDSITFHNSEVARLTQERDEALAHDDAATRRVAEVLDDSAALRALLAEAVEWWNKGVWEHEQDYCAPSWLRDAKVLLGKEEGCQ